MEQNLWVPSDKTIFILFQKKAWKCGSDEIAIDNENYHPNDCLRCEKLQILPLDNN
jgi:hypothetical protein